MEVKIKIEDIEKVMNYLARRPWIEVKELMELLMKYEPEKESKD